MIMSFLGDCCSHFVEKSEAQSELQSNVKQEATSSDSFNSKKKRDRFNGMTEEDVLKRTVPDLLCPNLDIIIVSTRIHRQHPVVVQCGVIL